MKTITLNFNEVDGMITDATGFCVGSHLGAVPVKPEESRNTIDDLINLKSAGFTTDEIVELKRKELI